jgi:hypothetical protein
VTSFKRITTGDRPQKIYAVRADLGVPNVGVHASADRVDEQWRTNTLAFAERVDGAIAAVNADWSCNSSGCTGDRWLRPLGLAVHGGVAWNSHRVIRSDPNERWGYLSCTVDKQCRIRTRVLPLNNPDMATSPLQTPTIAPLRAHNAVGGNGIKMITDGVAGTGCYDTTSAPRSAVCLEQDGTHLWIVVVDGRNASGGETGMTCAEMRDLLAGDPFHCWNALMLDGGGSSTLVVEDQNDNASCFRRGARDLCVKNSPSDGSLRTVGNHLAITWTDTVDPRCVIANGSWCDGSRILTCEGGRIRPERPCADGASCQTDGAYAFCVDPRCPGGDGLGRGACVDATVLGACTDGTYATRDCAADGRVCGGDDGSAGCMDARCPAPDGARCDGDRLVACAGGSPTETDCAAQGLVCDPQAGCVAAGVDAGAPAADAGSGPAEAGVGDDGVPVVDDDDGGPGPADAGADADAGETDRDTNTNADADEDDDDGDEDDDRPRIWGAPGCAARPLDPALGALGALLVLGRWRRRGGHPRPLGSRESNG